MSDGETTKAKAKGGVSAWTEHEVLIYLLSAIEHNGVKIDYANSPAPVGRNGNSCMQKINKLKIALRAEIDAVKAGVAIEGAGDATPKKTATPRKRKGAATATEEDGEGTPKKRGRSKKNAVPEVVVKDEAKDEQDEDEDVDVKGEV